MLIDSHIYSFKGSEKEAYKHFYSILKNDLGKDVNLIEHKTMIPITLKDKLTDEPTKRVFVPKFDYTIIENTPKPKKYATLIKAIKASDVTGV